jgi:hypothetical protein
LVNTIRRYGGQVLTRCKATKIVCDETHATGVEFQTTPPSGHRRLSEAVQTTPPSGHRRLLHEDAIAYSGGEEISVGDNGCMLFHQGS